MGSSSKENGIYSWGTLPIGVFEKLYRLGKKEITEDRPYEIVAILNNMTLEQVYDMRLDDVHELIQRSAFLNEKPKINKVRKQYEINGRKYDVFLNEKDITVSQYVDFQAYAQNVEEHLPQFLSVFFVPEGKTYNNGYNIEFVQNELNSHLDVETALSLVRFFFRKCRKSIRRTLLYSQALLTATRMTAPKEMKGRITEAEKMVREMSERMEQYGLDSWTL